MLRATVACSLPLCVYWGGKQLRQYLNLVMNETGEEDRLRFALRPYVPDDNDFLYELYCSTRIDEFASVGLSEAQLDRFFRIQFQAQQQTFGVNQDESDHRIILVGEERAGRILTFRLAEEIRLADIALLPAYRNRGIGAYLIHDLQTEAENANKPLRLHVAHTNPARRLYARLGFVIIGDTGSHLRMEWKRD